MKRMQAFGFEPGNLNVRVSSYGDQDGSGYFWFYEEDISFENEEGRDFVSVEVPHSELIALRDHLNKMFPVEKTAA